MINNITTVIWLQTVKVGLGTHLVKNHESQSKIENALAAM